MEQRGPQRPCKFGTTCNRFQQGTCTFLHDSNGGIQPESSGGGMGGFGGKGAMGGGMGGGFNQNDKPCAKGINCDFWKAGKCKFFHPQPYVPMNVSGGVMNPTIQSQGMGGQGMGGQPKPNKCKYGMKCHKFAQGKCNLDHNNDGGNNAPVVNQQYCRFWMIGDNCKNQHCKKQHSVSNDGSIERIFYTDELPYHPRSGIGAMKMGDNHLLFPQINNTIYSLQFSPSNQQIQKMSFEIPNEQLITFSKVEGNWIIFSYGAKFQTIKLWNSQIPQQIFTIQQAHQKPVTGLAMLTDQILISSANEQNPVKIWILQDNKFTLNPDITKKFTADINNSKVQIFFLKVVKFDKSYLCAGTNDGRILLWILEGDAVFNAISLAGFPEYVNIYDFDIKNINQRPTGFALVWKLDKQHSGIFKIDLQTSQIDPLLDQQSVIIKMLITPGFLVTSNLKQQVNFYRIAQNNPNSLLQKVGTAYFDNNVIQIVYLQMTTQTLITMKHLLVMESFVQTANKNAESNKGSLSIFRME